jgi:hypothetical protein
MNAVNSHEDEAVKVSYTVLMWVGPLMLGLLIGWCGALNHRISDLLFSRPEYSQDANAKWRREKRRHSTLGAWCFVLAALLLLSAVGAFCGWVAGPVFVYPDEPKDQSQFQ